ncbi:methyl-CpG-binding domain-containing protein 9 isoform X1 [Vigna angularis]|uniref:methyl-CpG-binding domain-containing protein 9 isoform X1 n=1 Tax=Phaseolus angularis TaxID=3914 RepID=UPI0022B52F3D|nr:methyl-CpG-binding domain-containing protein 9 isoform X1 [Vigna angularis]
MIMELPDSTGGDRNLNAPPPQPQHNNHHQDARSGLGIDLNEIPSPSSLFAETLPDSVTDVVRTYHENPGPPPGAPAALPSGGLAPCAACSKPCPAAAGSHHHLVVCDGCERGFHLACAGIRGGGRQAASLEEWVCGECVASGVKSKRWPLGVKQLLDINAPPPSEAEAEGVGDGDVHDLRKHTRGDNYFGASPFGAPVTYSNFYNGNATGFQKASGGLTQADRVGFEDILNHTQSITRKFEEALKDFISERRGVLEEGWRVEFRQSVSSSELYAVYCAPDGKIFDSVYEVACYLGLMSGFNAVESEIRHERSLVSLSGSLSRKKKSTRSPVVNGFVEKRGTMMNSNCKDPSSEGLNVECASTRGNIAKPYESGRKEDGQSFPQQFENELPLQFKDFFVLSLGKVDVRPSYYDVNLICPVGYKSCWHDKITGSLFTCEVLEGGDSGPIFRIRRCSCSEFPVPVGSTILSLSKCCQLASQADEGNGKTNGSMDLDDGDNIQMMLQDPCVPTENDVLSCSANFSIKDTHTPDALGPATGSVQDNAIHSLPDEFNDGIGEFCVEERSSCSAWRVISQKLVDACKDLCKQKGTLKFYCNHVKNETCLHQWDLGNVKSDELDKFCGSLGSVGIPDVIYADSDLEGISEALRKWLEQDRFGLDVEFVQEVLEQLPGVESLQYELLNCRDNSSSLPTVENGFLVVEWREGSKHQEEALQGLYRRSKKASLTKKSFKEGRRPPLGKPLCSRAPGELIGDIFQAWELLERFNEVLDLQEPLSLDELEKELISPWFDGLDFLEKSERDMDLISEGTDGNCRPLLSLGGDTGPSGSMEGSHAFIQMETEAMKEAAQVKLASFTYARCFGVTLTKAHNSLLRVLIGELLSRVAVLVDPNSEPGETRTRRGRKKDMDSGLPAKRTKLNMLPINELTWPELARRYILAFLTMDGNLESAEITARESGKVFRCLRGDGGLLCGALTGVAGMEADAQLLAEATKKIFGSLNRQSDVLTMEEEESDAKGASEKNLANDGNVPEWAQMLEPVRKLPTNVGTRIRKCVYDALSKDPPEWARKKLEHSISKEVYKGNASGPTKKAVLSVLADVAGEGGQSNPSKGQKRKIVISISDIMMKRCRIVLRRAAAADDSKVFCNLLGRKLINSSDNDDEGLLGSPAMVARPLDFRTIDLRLAAGAYGGSHDAFLEDVRELWNNVRVAFGDQPDLLELAEKLSQNFESLYNEEVVMNMQKLMEYAKLECLTAEMRKEVDDFIESMKETPKAPWDEGVCKVCGIDRDDDSVLLCDTCDAEYHTYCLNPPLARIPEGNWYCPSCVDGKHATQDVTERTQVIGKRRSKKFQGEVNSLYLESLTHLSAVIEEKEYWEHSLAERTFLLKFLCDELLNSSMIRQHLEQCAELSAELHQKLRAHSVEWKNLKTREDVLSTKAAKIDTFSLNTSGEVGLREGVTTSFSNTAKCLVQPHTAVDNPSNFGVFDDSLPSEETTKEKYRFDSVDKSISVTNSDSDSQNLNSLDVEGQFRNVSGGVESQCTDKSPKSFPSPNMSQEINGSVGAADAQGNHHKCEGRDMSTPVTCQQGGVPVDASHMVLNESEPYHLELNAIKRDISLLQDSITNVVSQLLKLSVRREFLGIDSIGRLYWASTLPGGHSRIVVDASAALLHGKGMSFSRDYVEKFSVLQNCSLTEKDSSPFMSQLRNALVNSAPWIAYETDAEIEELLGWLDDNDPKERELKDSIMQGPRSRFQEFLNAKTEEQVEDQGPVSIPRNREKTISNSLVTKATSLLEKKYGPFFEWDIETWKKQNKKSRTTNDEKLFRCECLEPIWPYRRHCTYCHKTVLSDVEFDGHNDGKCNAGLPVAEKNRNKIGSSKGKGNLTCDGSREKFRADAETSGTKIGGGSKLSSRVIKFSNEESTCPFNFEDICSKFETSDSNKELVKEIGLIGSDGIPSFVPSVSPFVSEYAQFSTSKDDIIGILPKPTESWGSQGNTDGAGACLDHNSGISTGRLAVNESNKSIKSSSSGEQRDGKFSFCGPVSDMGDGCCVVPLSSLKPLVGKVSHILRQLKINLLDMDAALPAFALRPSKAESDRRQAWRAFVKSAETIYEMIQATFSLEDMIKTEYLRNDWWYWSSFSAAAKSSTLPSLALRIYSLDLAIIYEKTPNSSLTDSSEPSGTAETRPPMNVDAEKSKGSRKSNRKRKESDG